LIDAELAGYILVTYRVSGIDEEVRNAADNVVMVTRETDQQEQLTLQKMCENVGADVNPSLFQELGPGEAALLPGAAEAHGSVQRFQIGRRLTSHVRHRAKYVDMPVSEPQGFVFTHDGRPGARARSLKEFVDLLAALPDADLAPHLQRHDFSRWLSQVFRDHPLATRVRSLEGRLGIERPRDLVNDIAQTVRARYEMTQLPV
jgi:hypothetical protein